MEKQETLEHPQAPISIANGENGTQTNGTTRISIRNPYTLQKATFTIPGRLASLNDIIAAGNQHRMVGAKLKRDETQRCAWHILQERIPIFTGPIRLWIYWYEKNRKRDVDNVASGIKFILDALVETGRIPNDGRRWVHAISHHFPEPDKTNPRVLVCMEEA